MAVGATLTVRNNQMLKDLRRAHDSRIHEFGTILSVQMFTSMSKRLNATYTSGGFRTGLLNASLTPNHPNSVQRVGRGKRTGPTVVEAGSNVRYAAQVDQGGTINPIPPRQMLAIPLEDRLKRAGLAPFDIDPGREILTALRPDEGGDHVFLFDMKGILGFGKKPLYVLVRSVTQQGKHFTDHPSVINEIKDAIPDLYERWLDAA